MSAASLVSRSSAGFFDHLAATDLGVHPWHRLIEALTIPGYFLLAVGQAQ